MGIRGGVWIGFGGYDTAVLGDLHGRLDRVGTSAQAVCQEGTKLGVEAEVTIDAGIVISTWLTLGGGQESSRM